MVFRPQRTLLNNDVFLKLTPFSSTSHVHHLVVASQGARSSVTEQDILDTLAEHAKRIADSVLSNKDAGQDLEKDVKVGFSTLDS